MGIIAEIKELFESSKQREDRSKNTIKENIRLQKEEDKKMQEAENQRLTAEAIEEAKIDFDSWSSNYKLGIPYDPPRMRWFNIIYVYYHETAVDKEELRRTEFNRLVKKYLKESNEL